MKTRVYVKFLFKVFQEAIPELQNSRTSLVSLTFVFFVNLFVYPPFCTYFSLVFYLLLPDLLESIILVLYY